MSVTGPETKLARLRELLAEVSDLRAAASVLYWDQQTQMPRGGAPARADQLTTLRRLAHERFTVPEIGELLDDLKDHETAQPYDGDEAGLLRVARREYGKAKRVPKELVAAMSRASAEAYERWLVARKEKRFSTFAPSLRRIVTLSRELAEALGYEREPLDALVDQHEPGLTAAALDRLFAELRSELVPLARAIAARSGEGRDRAFRQRFDPAQQLELARAAARAIGFNLDERGRQALSVHPFSISFSPDDTRITTRTNENWLGPCLFGLLHEAGHGTYMQGIPVRYRRTPLDEGSSSGLHESQSRLWENIVGRSRPFWQFFLPIAKAFFPAELGGVTVDEAYVAANTVKPSLVRVEADEVTYNLHIMVRFELERAVFADEMDVSDLAESWNSKIKDYLGITPGDDLAGVLQDIHWTEGFGASFQSYTIGNVASVALYRKALTACPNMHAQWVRGDFSSLLQWMRTNVHAHGTKFRPEELLQRATGERLTARPYLEHIREKYTELYGLGS
jgi:carboxypeptidase Taq